MHDAAIEAGLVERPAHVVTADEFNLAYRQELEAQVERMKADRTVQELEELEEDGEDDDEIIAQMRQKRIEEMKAARDNKLRQGRELHEVDPFDFEQQVQVPSRQGYVLLLVYRGAHSDSALMQGVLRTFAHAHPSVVCLQMHVSQHIANLPPQDCPVLLVYRHGKVAKQFVQLEALAGKETNAQGETDWRASAGVVVVHIRVFLTVHYARCFPSVSVLEWELADAGVVDTPLEEDPRIRIRNAKKLAMKQQQEVDDTDSDDD